MVKIHNIDRVYTTLKSVDTGYTLYPKLTFGTNEGCGLVLAGCHLVEGVGLRVLGDA